VILILISPHVRGKSSIRNRRVGTEKPVGRCSPAQAAAKCSMQVSGLSCVYACVQTSQHTSCGEQSAPALLHAVLIHMRESVCVEEWCVALWACSWWQSCTGWLAHQNYCWGCEGIPAQPEPPLSNHLMKGPKCQRTSSAGCPGPRTSPPGTAGWQHSQTGSHPHQPGQAPCQRGGPAQCDAATATHADVTHIFS
jgi:hypothetical protein